MHLQEHVAKVIKRLIENGYLKRANEITEGCLVRPAVITVKKDKSIKTALDSRKLNEATIKRKTNKTKYGRTNFKNSEKNIRSKKG